MKANVFKYIFFSIVIFLIGLAIYLLYKDGNKQVYATKNNEVEINMIRELNIGITGFDTINPILSNNRDIQYIDKLIFEPLVDITYDFKIENKLAKEFSKINDTTYIVKLRDDVYFHDGVKFTAEDVTYTINNLKNDITSIYKENVNEIKQIQKIDDYTIKIILSKPVEFFEYMMCIPIVAKHSYFENSFNLKNDIPVGTGKFKITKVEDDSILIERHNNENISKITKINLILKKTAKDLYMALTKQEIDFMITDNIQYEEYIGSIGYNVTQYAGREFEYLVFNTKSSLLSKKEIRQAISYAIDRNKINYNTCYNKYTISNFPLDYGNYLYNSNNEIEYDINKSKNILIENGWILKNDIFEKNNKNLRLKLLVNKENDIRVKMAENIKEQLKEIGIIIDIIATDSNKLKNDIKTKKYDIILSGNIISNNPRLNTYFGDSNLSNFNNNEINNILKEIKSIDNQEEILEEKYTKLYEIYKEEIPFMSLYFNSIFILTNKNLKGDLGANWYNIYYNIDNWYKVEDN